MLSSPLIVFKDKVTDTQTHTQTDTQTHRQTDKSDHNTPSHFMWRGKKKEKQILHPEVYLIGFSL